MQKYTTKNMMIVWVLVVVVVIGILIFISTHKKVDTSSGLSQGTQTNMQNIQQPAQVPGVKVTITQEGTGAAAKSGDTVAMNYIGRLADGTVFDSNVDPKFQHVEPFVFTIGAGMVIKGWDVGVAGMKTGEKRTLVIDPDYGYGAAGAGGVIPPNATLTFDVELVAIKP